MNETSKLLEDRQAQLGKEFGAAFHGLWNDWVWGLMRFNEFRELFSRAEDVELQNALTGGSLTWDIQRVLWDDLLLRVCRLTDPPKSGGKSNLSVTRLTSYCEEKDPKLAQNVQRLVKGAEDKARFARDWRNRYISHADWERAVSRAKPLEPASLQQIGDALDAVHSVLNAISKKLLGAEIANIVVVPPRAGEFLYNTRQLVDSVKFIDAIVKCVGETDFRDVDAAKAFLRQLGREPNMKEVMRVIELRKVASRFD